MAGPSFKGSANIPNLKEVVRRSDVALALGLIGILALLIVPMPRILLDISLAFSITISILILMTTLFIQRPLELSTFPTILLISTMLRLALNVASTRLILSRGHEGPDAAGDVIRAFGSFLMGESFFIGLIIFFILIIVNFIVITKGSGRIAEVSARFSLDSLPGKQMAIDADLSAGLIDEKAAKERRKTLEFESNFFGAMDGAAKFVRGDAIAGLLITAINIIGGMIIGISHGLTFEEAAQSYTILTVGDGLVTQIPALMVSTAAGMLVSKVGTEQTTDKELFAQLGAHPIALGLCSFLLIILGFLPGVPKIPFFFLSFLTGASAWYLTMRLEDKAIDEETSQKPIELTDEEKINQLLKVDPIRIELGYALLSLAKAEEKNNIPLQIKTLRSQLASEMGYIIPSVRIRDNLQLHSNQYTIFVRDVEVTSGTLRPGSFLVMNPSGDTIEVQGEKTKDPTFGIPAVWITDDLKDLAEEKKYTVVDTLTVFMTHFSETIKESMADMLSFEDVQDIVSKLDEPHGKLIKEIVPEKLSMTSIQRVLQNLLRERISIRDIHTILEGIAEIAPRQTHHLHLTEHVRSKLSRQICAAHLNGDGVLPVIHLGPNWQRIFQDALVKDGEIYQLALSPTDLHSFVENVQDIFEKQPGELPVFLTPTNLRPYIRSIVERFRSQIPVLSQSEIHPKIRIKTLGEVKSNAAAA